MSVIVRNISYNFAAEIWLTALSFIALPIIVHKLGVEAYGTLTISQVVAGYFSLLDLGFGAALIKYVAEYYSGRNFLAIERACNTLLVVYLGVGLLGGILIFGLAKTFATKVFQIPPTLVPVATTVFQLSGFGFFLNMSLSIFCSIPNALQRMDITNKRNILLGSLNLLGTVGLLYLGKGLVEIAILGLMLNSAALLVFVLISKRLLPQVRFKIQFDYEMFKHLSRFSVFRFISSVNVLVVYQLDRLLIGMFLPISALTYYEVPLKLVQRAFNTISKNILTTLLPEVSAYSAPPYSDRIKDLYIRSARMLLAILLPISLVLIFFNHEILSLWMGEEFATKSAGLLRLLSLGYLLISCANAPGTFAEGLGRPEIAAKFSVISTVFRIICFFIFVPWLGIEGTAVALIVAVLLQQPFFMSEVNRKAVKISNYSFVRESYFSPLMAGFFIGAVFVLMKLFVHGLISLIFGLLLGGSAYLIICYLNGTLDSASKDFIRLHVFRVGNHLFRGFLSRK